MASLSENELTPMLSQYHYFKNQYPDCLLLFRLGDFYELFYEDAFIGARELNLVLTSRPAGKNRERIPMCGVPYHSANSYISQLVAKGYKLAICEQIEEATPGKIVKRDVIRVITPGTFFEKETGGLLCLVPVRSYIYSSYINLSVGEFICAKLRREELADFIAKFSIKEVLLKKGDNLSEEISRYEKVFFSFLEEEYFERGVEELIEYYKVSNYRAFGFEEEEMLLPAGGAFYYVKHTQKAFMPFLPRPKVYKDEGFVRMDAKAIKGLELIESIEGRRDQSLFSVIDRTLTGMGKRRLKFYLMHPLRSKERIKEIQEGVEELKIKRDIRKKIREALDGMADLERLVSKISSNMASPRDLVLLKEGLKRLDTLRSVIKGCNSKIIRNLEASFEDYRDIKEDIENTLVEDPPLHVKEGGLIKEGVDEYLDELRYYRDNTEKILREYEAKLKNETGIGSLKIGYNKVMGYYIEVTKPNLKYVPSYFRRRQTLSNAERFTTDELQRLEEKILSAQTKINNLEYELFVALRNRVVERIEVVGRNANIIGDIDYIQSLAEIADEKGWTKPDISEDLTIEIEEGRHPVIEAFNRYYVPNDTIISEKERILIITGPNMAGKSSYIRQVALLTLMAHMGSFIPCKRAKIGMVDAIFTRIGSGDILALGVSTFMNEMLDVAGILNNATEKSLIVLDEVGRGTSTYDGIAIAKAVLEYIAKKIKARTLFATHFLEVTRLADSIKSIKNYRMAVRREEKEINFLYTLEEGVAEGSFGIDVAKSAGLPEEVIKKAQSILETLYTDSDEKDIEVLEKTFNVSKLEDLIKRIAEVDIANITPVKALLILNELKEEAVRYLKETERIRR